jgi:hypothetical protein
MGAKDHIGGGLCPVTTATAANAIRGLIIYMCSSPWIPQGLKHMIEDFKKRGID